MTDGVRIIFKKGCRCWSDGVGLHCGAVAVEASDGVVRFWIWAQAEHDRLVG
jgi:hypothetical protein